MTVVMINQIQVLEQSGRGSLTGLRDVLQNQNFKRELSLMKKKHKVQTQQEKSR
jgi:hypothetical protein